MTWLDRERLTVYPRIFVALYVVVLAWSVLTGSGLIDRNGKPIGGDFVTFYAASVLLAEDRPAALYDVARLHAVEQRVIGAPVERFAWHYPPTAMLAVAPLRLVPYGVALLGLLAVSVTAYLVVIRAIDRDPVVTGLALAFPGLFQTVIQGQNGAVNLALLGGGLLLLDARPLVGGALLGMLAYKPHLLPLVVVALVAGRQPRAVLGLVIGVATTTAASLVVWGTEVWTAFAANVPFAQAALYDGGLPWAKMPTVSAMLLLLGVPASGARAAQLVVSTVLAVVVGWSWATGHPHRRPALVLAVLLATPFAFDYDLAILALPLAWLGTAWRDEAASRPGARFRSSDAALLALGWVTPIAAPAFAVVTRLQLAPLVLGALLVVALARRTGGRPDRA